MKITQSIDKNILRININGELDANSSIKLDTVIKEALKNGQHLISVDCEELDFISSAGMGVFISHMDEIKELGGRFILYNMSEIIYLNFSVLGIHEILDIVDDLKSAEKLLNEG